MQTTDETIISMLDFLNPNCTRDEWVQIGMSIHSATGSAGYPIFRNWSMGGANFKESSCFSVWKSFKGGSISIGSLIHKAKENGWAFTGGEMDFEKFMEVQRQREAENKRLMEQKALEQLKAKEAANEIVNLCTSTTHAYLEKKGFGKATGLTINHGNLLSVIGEDYIKQPFYADEHDKLVVPMWKKGEIWGVQLIDIHGEKKFLRNQSNSGASLPLGFGRNTTIYCEGYATGLSVKEALKGMGCIKIYICFSVSNLKSLARDSQGFIVADHDYADMRGNRAGHVAVEELGLPYWMSDNEGNDFNDDWLSNKIKATASLKRALFKRK